VTRLAIAADLHVDDFGTRLDPRTGWNARFEDAIAAVEFIAEAAVQAKVDALIVAGDYTERRSPAPPRVARIRDALALGPARQIHLRGNHDQERSGRSIVDVLGATDGWEGFTAPGIDLIGDVAICAIPFLGPSHLRAQEGFEAATPADVYRALGEAYLDVARGLYARARTAWPDSTPILVGHQQLAGGRMNDAQAAFLGDMDLVVDARALAAIGFAAVIFGHVHRGQVVITDPDCPVLFVGSAHRVDFAEELEEKRFLLLDVNTTGHVVETSIESVAIPARRFVTLRGDGAAAPGSVDVAGAIVRCLDVPLEVDPAELRRALEELGAVEVIEIRQVRTARPEIVGGLAEGLSAEQALDAWFADDSDRQALVERGRVVLAEIAA